MKLDNGIYKKGFAIAGIMNITGPLIFF